MEFEKSLDSLCKQIMKNNNKNYAAFYLVVSLLVFAMYLIILAIYKICKFIYKKVKERIAMNEYRKKQEEEHLRCKALLTPYLQTSNCTLSFEVLDTQTNKFNETKQNINFYAFNTTSSCIDNINELVNGVLYNTLEIEGKGKHKGSIVIDAKDMVQLTEDISKEYNVRIKSRYIK